jgi:uncharacterized protein involved in response to NO
MLLDLLLPAKGCKSFAVDLTRRTARLFVFTANKRRFRYSGTDMPPDPNLIVHEVLSWVVPGLVMIVLGFPIVRLITKWLEPKPVPPRELSTISGRLERIEAAVDAIAVEVERISESQRFTARLQSEQSPRLPGAGGSSAR